VAAACGGGGDSPTNPNPNPNPPPGTLALALGSNSSSAVAGTSVTVPVTITRGGSFTGAVTLTTTGAPTGVTPSFSAATVAAGSTTSTLTLQVAASVAAGAYPITVRAEGTGVTAATATYTLTVTAAPVPSFTLAAAPGAVTVVAGQQGTSTITITRDGGFAGAVQLAAEGAPTGVTPTFSANPVAGGTATLTLAVGAAAAPGTYPITVRGTATGLTERTATVTLTVTAAPTLTIASTVTAVSITQAQQSAPIVLLLTRGGGLTGDITMALEGAPAGVNGTFTPNPATGPSTSLVVSVGANVAAGTYPLVVRGTVGGVSATFALQLTVTAAAAGDFALAMVPAAVTVTAGQTALSTVNIARTGGFTGVVNLTVTGLPAGATPTFVPAAAAGAQSQLGIVVAAGTPAGTYTLTVRGNATLLPERTATLTLTVQAPSGGSGNVTWRFCDTDRFPLWLAFQDGIGGAWTRVLPTANQTYSFTIASNRGGVAYVNRESGSNADVYVFLASREELQQLGQAECTTNPARKTLNGTVAGLGAAQTASVYVGGGNGSAAINGPFTVTNVNDGAVDLLAVRNSFDLATLTFAPDRLILRRGVNYPNNGAIPLLDFGGAESFAPASAAITVANDNGDQLQMTSGFASENSGFTGILSTVIAGGATRTLQGVPLARTQAGDLHQLGVIAISGTTAQRAVFQYNREFTTRTITLGPALTAPTVSSLGSAPYPRLRAAGPFQTEYGQQIAVTYTQTSGGGRSWSITATPAWYGNAATYQLDLPDLTSADGFQTTWALAAGVTTTWSASAAKVENAPIGPFVENFRLLQASRTGTITP
jgi:uncharacterized membrane protein